MGKIISFLKDFISLILKYIYVKWLWTIALRSDIKGII